MKPQNFYFTSSNCLREFVLNCEFDVVGFGAAWHLDFVEVENLGTHSTFSFPCRRWLSKTDDDKQIVREIPCANMPSPRSNEKTGKATIWIQRAFSHVGWCPVRQNNSVC